MAAKQVKTQVKVVLPAGAATPAPPLGPILGQHGVPIMDFVKAYNDKTADKKGQILPALITIYEDRSFDFEVKLPPASELIKKKANIQKGSGVPNRDKVGVLSDSTLTEIATEKLPDLNTTNVEAAKKIIAGSARSMGVKIEN
ncbi:50S ribosomal protein L11 [Candidatus Microgenomates bacterium]|nr:MAG: 50S ribosomal protein L11 [Candidatus Microgenomates bacterium]